MISDDVCIVVRHDKLLILVHEQREKRHKLESELEHLTNERKNLEDDWASLLLLTLSEKAVGSPGEAKGNPRKSAKKQNFETDLRCKQSGNVA